ncbi:hypothetical protein [Sphingomonas sp. SRS2]|uniref:hypothetical protein n=1 Tax=Sphingomonas sp. SRS2 TaxID=133190 RepID=UPI0006184542|nr:hypothetical protein [Sphingomonas sp. SRS2]KKC28006.1 hypothetical protein WP12_00210 [Sphingomonas sp. SRS2]
MEDRLDYTGLEPADAERVRVAIRCKENFHGYIPSQGFDFIIRNYPMLAEMGMLEDAWVSAYLSKSHFADHGAEIVRAIFEACDSAKLRELKPVADSVNISKSGRVSLFRGCAGPSHSMGMSWTTSLDKAIYYAAHKAAFYDQPSLAVYAATVGLDEIYCRFDRNEEEFIVVPKTWWKVDVPDAEFRLDRPR